MEDVKRLMELVDENSKNISEGSYLEMCNLLKNLHRGETTPLITEAERHSHLVELYELEQDHQDVLYKIYRIDLRLDSTEFTRINNITKKVKRDAIRELCSKLSFIETPDITYDELVTKYETELRENGHSHLVQGVKEERLFYQAYKAFSNLEKMKKMQQLVDEKHRHTLELLHINVRINELIDTYNL